MQWLSKFVRRGSSQHSSQILHSHRDTLLRNFDAVPDLPRYRPDLYPEQLNFELVGGRAKAAILEDYCLHVMLALNTLLEANEVVELLAKYSGSGGWKLLPREAPILSQQFPAFNPLAANNSFYSAEDQSAVALAQAGTPLGRVVVWLQSAEYLGKLASYRATQRGSA